MYIHHALSGQGPGCSMAPGPHRLDLQALACPRHPHFPRQDVRLERVRLEAVHRATCRAQHRPACLPCPVKEDNGDTVSRFSEQDLLQRITALCLWAGVVFMDIMFFPSITGCHCIPNVCPEPNSWLKCVYTSVLIVHLQKGYIYHMLPLCACAWKP